MDLNLQRFEAFLVGALQAPIYQSFKCGWGLIQVLLKLVGRLLLPCMCFGLDFQKVEK